MSTRSRSWTLWAFLAGVAVVVGYGAWLRWRPVDFETALRELVDGDADRRERLALLEKLRDEGGRRLQTDDDVAAGVIAAVAAIELSDALGYRDLARRLRGRTPLVPGGRPVAGEALERQIERAAAGQPYLTDLLRGTLAEHRSDVEVARAAYERAARSARLYGAELARLLARDGALRTR